MPATKVRVAGSGFTTFNYRGKPIAFLDNVVDSGQRALGSPEGIIPIGAYHPIEVVTGRVLDFGTLSLTIRELWNEPVWYQLAGLDGVGDSITDVWQALAEDPAQVTCQMIVKPPGSSVWRGRTYHNCIVTDIPDGEDISVGNLSIRRTIVVAYTHKTPFTAPARG